MSDTITEAADALDRLSASILTMNNEDRPFNVIWGSWNLPAITRHDLARYPSQLALRLRGISPKSLSSEASSTLVRVPDQVSWLQGNTIPNIPGGNAHFGVAVIKDFCESIDNLLPIPSPTPATVDWKAAESQKVLPPELLKRLRSIEASLKNIEPRVAKVNEDIEIITEGRAAALDLPTTLQDLDEKKSTIQVLHQEAIVAHQKTSDLAAASASALKDMTADRDEAAVVLNRLNEAYRAATTQGLAAAFGRKAFTLNITLSVWIVALALDLVGAAYLSNIRFVEMGKLLSDKNIPTDRLWIQAVFATVSIGGPIWFAWLATKQIGQRFRMAEDYAYKATVAKAYEGYRLEAVRLTASSTDLDLQSRLFATAVGRLEEAPLRLIETQSHSSPLSELMESPAFIRAVEVVPELKDTASRLLQTGLTALQFKRKQGTADGS